MRRAAWFGCLAIAALLGGCSQAPQSILEQGPRYPDVQGVVSDIDVQTVRIDNKATYRISPEIESFNSKTHKVTALRSWKGWYVQVGLNDKKEAIWIAGLGLTPEAAPGTATYGGVFDNVDEKKNAIFKDGTVLALASGVKTPPRGSKTAVTIDTAKHRASKLEWLNL